MYLSKKIVMSKKKVSYEPKTQQNTDDKSNTDLNSGSDINMDDLVSDYEQIPISLISIDLALTILFFAVFFLLRGTSDLNAIWKITCLVTHAYLKLPFIIYLMIHHYNLAVFKSNLK